MNALTEYVNGVGSLKFASRFRRRPDSSWRCVGGVPLILYVTILVTISGAAQQSSSGSPAQPEKALIQIRAYLENKRTVVALRLATQLSAERKGDAQLHLSLGVLLASEKQYRAAQLELEKADALQPGTFEIL